MILIGIHPGVKDCVAAVIEKQFRKGAHFYSVTRVLKFSHLKLEAEIESMFRDSAYCASKRLYSQDRRPKKLIKTNPVIVLELLKFSEDVANSLRHRQIAVEGVRLENRKMWVKEAIGKAVGDNYRVCERDVVDTLTKVITEDRLEITCPGNEAVAAERAMAGLIGAGRKDRLEPDAGVICGKETLLAVALPVWYRESVPYQRKYRAT